LLSILEHLKTCKNYYKYDLDVFFLICYLQIWFLFHSLFTWSITIRNIYSLFHMDYVIQKILHSLNCHITGQWRRSCPFLPFLRELTFRKKLRILDTCRCRLHSCNLNTIFALRVLKSARGTILYVLSPLYRRLLLANINDFHICG